MEWEPVIGLEIHVQLATHSKIFSGASTAYGASPNSQACAIDLGLPGVLPVLNREAVRMAIKFGLAINAQIADHSVFARKNYFYPDLPKGYQISQYELPSVKDGTLWIEPEHETPLKIGITRAHLEEDAGKSLHENFHDMTGIDLNRAGTPLLEIVSEPDLHSAHQAVAYMKKLHSLVRYLGISDGNMQEGSFRCDANVSVRPVGQTSFGTRTEIKNLNSFRFVERAIDYEIARQIEVLENVREVVQETRLYDSVRDETRPMRSKEQANDYRYFPDPDLLPLKITSEMIEAVRAELPELPDEKKRRFVQAYGLSDYDAGILTAGREMADYYEDTVRRTGGQSKLVANWVMGEVAAALNKAGTTITQSPISSHMLAGLLARVMDNTISGKMAKQVFEAMWRREGEADAIIDRKGLKQITDASAIEAMIGEILTKSPKQVAQYRAGKEKVFGYFVGQVMKASRGKANPTEVNKLLKEKLKA
jgi:aspartyl-tRNA(Asn)/glutamyl-tRNA(Gln) amidotransferase subunit B